MSIKFIDLFAGTGGFSFSFESNKNFKCVFSNDMIKETLKSVNNPLFLYV